MPCPALITHTRVLHPLLGHVGQAIAPAVVTSTAAEGSGITLHADRGVSTEATSHADSLANKARRVASGSLGGDAQHALDSRGDAQAEASEKGRQCAPGDEGHDDKEEDLPGVALGPVDEVAEEALQLLVSLLDEALARRALVVGRAIYGEGKHKSQRLRRGGGILRLKGALRLTGSKEAGAAGVATDPKEGGARRIVLAMAVAAKDGARKGAATVGGAGSRSRAGAALLVGARGAMAAVGGAGREDGGAVIPIEEAHCVRVLLLRGGGKWVR